mgnify:CR=1 FL=1
MKDKYLFWKIYFFLFIFIGLIGYITEINKLTTPYLIDLLISLPSLVALYGYAYKKKFLNKIFWKVYFVGFLIWHIIVNWTSLIIESKKGSIESQLAEIIFIPLFVAMYLYGFKNSK